MSDETVLMRRDENEVKDEGGEESHNVTLTLMETHTVLT